MEVLGQAGYPGVAVKKIWNFISALKNATGNLVFLGIVALILVAVFSRDTVSVAESAVLILNPEGMIVEQKRAVDPFEQLMSSYNGPVPETLLKDLLDAIDLARDDNRIKAIALDLSNLAGGSLSQMEEIVTSLESFKAADKPVYAFGSQYTQGQYYLASHADHVYLDRDSHPVLGGVFMTGVGAYQLYFKSALDNINVQFHVFKAGLYKGAAEIVMRDDMSPESKEATLQWIGVLWDNYLEDVGQQRNLTREQLDTYVNNYDQLLLAVGSDPGELAIEHGLVDEMIGRQEWREELIEIAGKSGDTYNHVDLKRYLAAMRPPIPVVDPTRDKVAIIVAKGTILDGEQPAGDVGGDSMVKLIRQARNDKTIKALVVRVDSGGGSASASEFIRSELVLTQESGKPVVVSMGGYAASGGYWISTSANKIFASETTVTGSIGAFMLFPTIDQTLDKMGIHSDGVGTTALTSALNPYMPINPVLQRVFQQTVMRTYRKFIGLVADARGLEIDEVDKIAQGRVWSGATALKLGLIDAIGSTSDAIESAAMLADIDDYDVLYLEQQLSPKELLLKQLAETSVSYLPPLFPGLFSIVPPEVRSLVQMSQNPGVYLQCTVCRVSF